MDMAEKRARYRELREGALGITDLAIAEGRQLTEPEQRQIEGAITEGKKLAAELEARQLHAPPELLKQLEEFSRTPEAMKLHEGDYTVDAHGRVKLRSDKGDGPKTREPHAWTKALQEARHLVGGHGEKAGVTGGGQGSVVVGSLADPAARLGTPGGEILALVTVEPWGDRGDGSSVEFLREATRDLNAAIVATGTAKPASDIGLDMVSRAVETYAHHIPGVPVQWVQDAANLDTLIRSELAYGVVLAVEDALVNAVGPAPAPVGIMEDTAVTQITAAADAPLSVLKGLTAIASAGYSTGVVALSPTDWEAILGMKDGNERYQFGGSPFAGPQRTLWSTPVVISVAIPAGTAVVGDIGGAVRMVEKAPVEVIVGTVNDELVRNLRTFLGEAREAFAIVRPQALAVVELS